MTKPLDGKVALVTGAGKNIGRAIALKLAADGAAIVVNGRSDRAIVDAVVGEIAAAGGKAIAAMGDVSDARSVGQMMGGVIAEMGGVDIVVSNAGLRRQTPFLDMQLAEWREILSVALDGAFILAKATVPSMVARGGGAFVALSGISTHVGTPNRCHVSASKAGLEGLMRALAVELASSASRSTAWRPAPSIPRAARPRADALDPGGSRHTAGPQGLGRRDRRHRALSRRARRRLHRRPDDPRQRRRVLDLSCRPERSEGPRIKSRPAASACSSDRWILRFAQDDSDSLRKRSTSRSAPLRSVNTRWRARLRADEAR